MNYCYLDTPIGKLLLVGDDRRHTSHYVSSQRKARPGGCAGRGVDRIGSRPPERSGAPAQRILRGTSNGIRSSAGARRHRVPKICVAASVRHSVWRDDLLRRTGPPVRKSESLARRGRGQWVQPSAYCGSLSSGHRSQRKDDWLWWRYPGEGSTAGVGIEAEDVAELVRTSASIRTGLAWVW